MCGNELGGTSTGLWLGARLGMSYDRSNFLINVRATQGAGALYKKAAPMTPNSALSHISTSRLSAAACAYPRGANSASAASIAASCAIRQRRLVA